MQVRQSLPATSRCFHRQLSLPARHVEYGVPEANPLVNAAISEWGVVWGLLYWKTLACGLLLLRSNHPRGGGS